MNQRCILKLLRRVGDLPHSLALANPLSRMRGAWNWGAGACAINVIYGSQATYVYCMYCTSVITGRGPRGMAWRVALASHAAILNLQLWYGVFSSPSHLELLGR